MRLARGSRGVDDRVKAQRSFASPASSCEVAPPHTLDVPRRNPRPTPTCGRPFWLQPKAALRA